MEKRDPDVIAKMLVNLFRIKFSQKSDRRNNFKIARADLLTLAGMPTLNDRAYQQIQSEAQARGYIFVDLGDEFAVLRKKPLEGYRKPTSKLVTKFISVFDSIPQKPMRPSERSKIIETKLFPTKLHRPNR